MKRFVYPIGILSVVLVFTSAFTQESSRKSGGYFDFKNPSTNRILVAHLEKPSQFSFYRYGDGQHPNSPVRILLQVDGNLVEAELPGSQGRKFAFLESEASVYLYGKNILLFTDPSQVGSSHIVRGQYTNTALDEYELLSPNWTLVTKANEHIHRTIVHLGTWKEPVPVRMNFGSVQVESGSSREDLLCMIYLDGKPLLDSHGIPYIFTEGNSIDVTAGSVSVGFHPGVDETFQGRIRGTFNIRSIDFAPGR